MADHPYAILSRDLDAVDPHRRGYGIEDREAYVDGFRYDDAVVRRERRIVTYRQALEEGPAA